MRVSQSRAELIQRLRKQLQFLEASAKSYDSGFEGEANRLAVVLRRLLHDAPQSHSLLGQLGLKLTLAFHDAVGHVSDKAVDFAALCMRLSPTGLRYYPLLDGATQKIPFDTWWSGPILVQRGVRLDRRHTILTVAHWAGGALVDPRLDRSFAALGLNKVFRWEASFSAVERDIDNSLVPPLVRQIAYEVSGTLREQVPEAGRYRSGLLLVPQN
jgi:hypothetical protein